MGLWGVLMMTTLVRGVSLAATAAASMTKLGGGGGATSGLLAARACS